MRSDLPQSAAFDTLRPEPPKVQPAEGPVVSALRLALGLSPETCVGQLVVDGRPLAGKYVVEGEGRKVFVKRVPPNGYDNHMLADEIAGHAASRGASVASLLEGYPKKAPDGFYFFAYPYLNHRYCLSTEADLSALGAALARLHVALRDFPGIEKIRGLTSKRYSELGELKAGIDAKTRHLAGVPAEVAACLRRQPFPPGALSDANVQLIHGDLNYSNACFPFETGEPQLIDFESSPRSYLSSDCDLAQVLDRFILTAPHHLWSGLFTAFSSSYARESGSAMPDTERLLSLISHLATRSLLLLCLRHEAGDSVDASEWRKFTRTYARISGVDRSELPTQQDTILPPRDR